MFNVGMTVSHALEEFTPAQKTAANRLPTLFEKAQVNGHFSDEIKFEIAEVCKKLTGLTYDVEIIDETNASMRITILPNLGGVKHINTAGTSTADANAIANWIVRHLNNSTPDDTFYYDQRTGRFSGKGIDKLSFTLQVGNGLLDKLDCDQLTGVVLHEIGHSWIMMRDLLTYFDQSVITQSAMLMGNKEALSKKVEYDLVGAVLTRLDKKKHPELYKKLEKKEYTKKEFVKACLLINDDIEMTSLSTAGEGGKIRRNEQAADYFAVRLGYGAALATGLRMIGVEVFGTAAAFGVSSIQMLLLGCSILAICTLPVMGVAALFCLFIISHEELMSSYDNNTARHKRIYRAMIEELKRAEIDNIDDKSKRVITEQLMDMQRYVEDTWDAVGVIQFLNPIYVRAYLGRKQEERLESLMNNDLFLTSAQLQLDM